MLLYKSNFRLNEDQDTLLEKGLSFSIKHLDLNLS